jgi:hypothetical protein
MNARQGNAYVLSAALALYACSCEPKKAKPKPPRFSIARLDGGQLTRIAIHGKALTEAIPGTSVRRSFVILNDATCPVKVSAFGLSLHEYSFPHSDCTAEEQRAFTYDCPRLFYDLEWTFKAQSPVTAWEATAYAFDQMNRFLWADKFANGTRGKDATGLELATEYKTDRERWLRWLAEDQAAADDNFGKWTTSVVLVTAARTKDGRVWFCDKEALKSQIGTLSLEIPSELK